VHAREERYAAHGVHQRHGANREFHKETEGEPISRTDDPAQESMIVWAAKKKKKSSGESALKVIPHTYAARHQYGNPMNIVERECNIQNASRCH